MPERGNSLRALLDEALDLSEDASTNSLVQWLRKNRAEKLKPFIEGLIDNALSYLFRQRRKARNPKKELDESVQMCLDFGLPVMHFDTQWSIPVNPQDLNSEVYWKDNNDCSLREALQHADYLTTHAKADVQKAEHIRFLVQRAKIYSGGDMSVTIAACRKVAREMNPPPPQPPDRPQLGT